jgi:hypothetical protein
VATFPVAAPKLIHPNLVAAVRTYGGLFGVLPRETPLGLRQEKTDIPNLVSWPEADGSGVEV